MYREKYSLNRDSQLKIRWIATCSILAVQLFSSETSTSFECWHQIQSVPKRCGLLGISASAAVLSRVVQVAGGACHYITQKPAIKNECALLSHLCNTIARHAFFQALHKDMGLSYFSWEQNRDLLRQITPVTEEDAKLLRFLQERWLAKVASYSALAIEWAYPCFGIHHSVHPQTNHSYARLLTFQRCAAYVERTEAWKKSLALSAPLVLTRKGNLAGYLPSYTQVVHLDDLPSILQKIGQQEITLDVTPLLATTEWSAVQNRLAGVCLENKVNANQIVCVQRLIQESIGGLSLLPLTGQSPQMLEIHEKKLLDWLSSCGLAANRVELDRWPVAAPPSVDAEEAFCHLELDPLKKSITSVKALQGPPHRSIMIQGTIAVLEALWPKLQTEQHGAKVEVLNLAISRITSALQNIAQTPDLPFLQLCAQLETVHADLSALLEIEQPYQSHHFSSIYRELLYKNESMPKALKNLTSCGIHSSGMTNLAAIVKAVETMIGKRPRVLYGDNTYYECVGALAKRSEAAPIGTNFENVDLLVEQFNPVLQLRFDVEYGVESIALNVRKCLDAKKGEPLTLALDCTIDFLLSPRLANLLQEFQAEIEAGNLNIVGFRSGNKFDLFGMDNYCGAPFFMVHNRQEKWNAFQSLWEDECLQADPLSLNWFCLAYEHAPHFLDEYRKQIFANTRALLQKVPENLRKTNHRYHVSPVVDDANLAFIDIKIGDPLHAYRGPALVAGLLYLKSIEAGHPLFNRPSLGFYHSNCTMQFGLTHSTVRLTVGLDPAEVDVFADCLGTINQL